MAQLLRLCALIGDCAQCCKMAACCVMCCEEEENRKNCLPVCILVVFCLAIITVGAVGLGLSLHYSSIANSDMQTVDCKTLCGEDYANFNASSCCIQSDMSICQAKQSCKQALLKDSSNWLTVCFVMAGCIFLFIIFCVLCAKSTKTVEKRKEEKNKSLVEPSIDQYLINNSILQAKKSKQTCFICCQVFKQEEKSVKLKCKHIFHHLCMKHYLQDNFSCPICHELIK